MKTPEKSITFSVLENEYKITFPNNGQYIELQSTKVRLSRDTYGALSGNYETSSQWAKYTIDMIAFMTILCPKLKEDLKVASLSELDMLSSKVLVKAYIEQIVPWLDEWETLLSTEPKQEESKEEKKSE